MTATATRKPAGDAQALDRYLRMLAGPAPGARLLEIRFALRYRDMGRLFIAAHSAPGASRLIRRLAARTDVYVGVCLRTRRAGGRDAIDRSHLAFVEIDAPDALDRLRAFRHPAEHDRAPRAAPVTRTRTTPCPRRSRCSELERANRASRTPSAVTLPPSTPRVSSGRRPRGITNTAPAPVELIELDQTRRYDVDELVDGLDDPPGPTVSGTTPGADPAAPKSTGCFSRSRRRIRARARRRLA